MKIVKMIIPKLKLKNLSKNIPYANLPSLFSLANGHFGVQATNPISKKELNGTLVNGFFEFSNIKYGEVAAYYPKQNETIVDLPSLRKINVETEDHNPFNQAKLIDSVLDMSNGTLKETYKLFNLSKETVIMYITSIVGQNNQNAYCIKYKFKPDSYNKKIIINKSIIDKEDLIYKEEIKDDPRKTRKLNTIITKKLINNFQQQAIEILATKSKLSLIITLNKEGSSNKLLNTIDLSSDDTSICYRFRISSIEKETLNNQKIYFADSSFNYLLRDNEDFWDYVWKASNVNINGDDSLNLAIHYNIFQLNQSAGRDSKTNIASKGLSGSGYEGHYFWDTEMYMLPYFINTQSEEAKKLLIFRYNILDFAKQRARELGVSNGALFAWRTMNGMETSAYYPASTAAYHIDGDIAYAIGKYFEVTSDIKFLKKYGFEMLLETARFWKNFGNWTIIDGKKRFGFYTVTGPDEYTALVNNNYYTNMVAKNNLMLAVKFGYLFDKENILNKYNTDINELNYFKKIAENIYMPFNSDKKINAQDDSFFEKPIWPFKTTPKTKYPLLLNYHPLNIYRYQVNKQADTLLADFLFPNSIDLSQLKREYDYYESITTHDSSLSRSIFSILAARLGNINKAYSYFMDTATMDLTDLQGNTADGLHLANLGGSWMAIVQGFAGMLIENDKLEFKPQLPKQWESYSFRQTFHGRLIQVTVSRNETNIKLISGSPIDIKLDGNRIHLDN